MKSIVRSLLLINSVDVCTGRPVRVCAERLRAFQSFDSVLSVRPALSIRYIHTQKVLKIFEQKAHFPVQNLWLCLLQSSLSTL